MTTRTPIRIMPPDLALKIAAGEVIERPASAVKELLDNAIDAGARHVRIEIREAGLKLIRVTDDGWGIPDDEVELAFTSHATSKIETIEDLERLSTLGFRGEALTSIAAVARVDIRSRAEIQSVGTRLVIEYGQRIRKESCSVPVGVRISVADLFGNVPARRTFVRSLRAETSQIANVVMLYAMAQPSLQLSLVVDDRDTFTSPGNGSVRDAFASVYGPNMAGVMHPLEYRDHDLRIDGLVSELSTSRANRSAIHVFVNGRPIGNRSLVYALEQAYSGFLMVGRHPLAVIHIELPARDIDPNIHPSKLEVRFARDREIHGSIHRAVANALLGMRVMESGGTAVLSFPDAGGITDAPLPLPDGEAPATESQCQLLPDVPALRVFGQTNETFIIAEGPQGIYMIDQHAAHERVLFDQFDQMFAEGAIPAQPLLDPLVVDLEPEQMLALEENVGLLTQAGFALEPFGAGACLVRAVPALRGQSVPADTVSEVLSELASRPEPAAARGRALAAMACKAAVKAGQPLDVLEMRELVVQLERTLRPATCPHGRPTMIHVSHLQLEREFGRR